MAAHSSETLTEMLPSALETLMPGLSFFTRTLSLYSHIDVSTCSSYILLCALLSAFFKFAVPRLYENLQQLILYFAASIEYSQTSHAEEGIQMVLDLEIASGL
jgi:chaperone BCS1